VFYGGYGGAAAAANQFHRAAAFCEIGQGDGARARASSAAAAAATTARGDADTDRSPTTTAAATLGTTVLGEVSRAQKRARFFKRVTTIRKFDGRKFLLGFTIHIVITLLERQT